MPSSFLEMFRDGLHRRQQEEQFNASLAEQRANRVGDEAFRKDSLAQSAGQWQKSFELQQQHAQLQQRQQEENTATKVLELMGQGQMRVAPREVLNLLPMSGGTQNSSPPDIFNLPTERSSTKNLEVAGPQILPQNAIQLGGESYVPTSPEEKAQRSVDLQDMIAKAQRKRLEDDALKQFPNDDEGWKRLIYVENKGDINDALKNPRGALSNVFFHRARTEKDFTDMLQHTINEEIKARAAGTPPDPNLSLIRAWTAKNLMAQAGGETLLGDTQTEAETNPNIAGLPDVQKAKWIKNKINTSKADARTKMRATKEVDDVMRLPPEKQKSALEVIAGQLGFNLSGK